MIKGVFDELRRPEPRRHVTVGIVDDVTHLSIEHDPSFRLPFDGVSAVSTASAATDRWAQPRRR